MSVTRHQIRQFDLIAVDLQRVEGLCCVMVCLPDDIFARRCILFITCLVAVVVVVLVAIIQRGVAARLLVSLSSSCYLYLLNGLFGGNFVADG